METSVGVSLLPSTGHIFHSILFSSFLLPVLYFSDSGEERVVSFELCQDLNICRAGKNKVGKEGEKGEAGLVSLSCSKHPPQDIKKNSCPVCLPLSVLIRACSVLKACGCCSYPHHVIFIVFLLPLPGHES